MTNNQNNNQNNSRFGNSPFGNNNQNDQNNQNNPPSRFGSRFGNNNQNNQNNQNNSHFGSSRFGNNNQNNQNNPSSRFSSGSRFSSNRFGQQPIFWTVAPMNSAAIRISLDGLGDPFHRLLGNDLNVEYGDPVKVAEALQKSKRLHKKLTKVLDDAWKSYDFQGAALLFPWDDDVRKAYVEPIFPNSNMPNNNNQNNQNANNQNNQNNNQYYDDDYYEDDSVSANVQCLRAIDLAFVLNILARSRANVVVGNTPLALEPAFLTQTIVTDDPRIVALARATGCIDEAW